MEALLGALSKAQVRMQELIATRGNLLFWGQSRWKTKHVAFGSVLTLKQLFPVCRLLAAQSWLMPATFSPALLRLHLK